MPAIAVMSLGVLDSPVVELKSSSTSVPGTATFNPDGFTATGAARYVDRQGGIPAAYPSVVLSMRPPSQGNRNYKATITCTRPTLETLGTSSQSGYLPGQKVGYAGVARAEFVLPERMTLAERKALLAQFTSVLSTAIMASDEDPVVSTFSPFPNMILNLETVF